MRARNTAFFTCLLLILTGCGQSGSSDFGWFKYSPPPGWEVRKSPEGVGSSLPVVTFVHGTEADPSLNLQFLDVSGHKSRADREAEVFLLGMLRVAQNPGPNRYEVTTAALEVPAAARAMGIGITKTAGDTFTRQWHAFLVLPDEGRVRVELRGSKAAVTRHWPAVRDSLRDLAFPKARRDPPEVDLQAAHAFFLEALKGDRLWPSENRIAGMRMRDAHLSVLAAPAFSGVTDLNLCSNSRVLTDGIDISDAGLEHLSGLPLEKLYLRSSLIRGPGLRHLQSMPLKTLILGETLMDDDALTHLEGLSLTSLGLSNTRVTDAGIEKLAGLPLRFIELQGSLVTPDGVAALKKAIPGLVVMY